MCVVVWLVANGTMFLIFFFCVCLILIIRVLSRSLMVGRYDVATLTTDEAFVLTTRLLFCSLFRLRLRTNAPRAWGTTLYIQQGENGHGRGVGAGWTIII